MIAAGGAPDGITLSSQCHPRAGVTPGLGSPLVTVTPGLVSPLVTVTPGLGSPLGGRHPSQCPPWAGINTRMALTPVAGVTPWSHVTYPGLASPLSECHLWVAEGPHGCQRHSRGTSPGWVRGFLQRLGRWHPSRHPPQ